MVLYASLKHLDSNTPLDDDNFEISGYTLVCSDHSSSTKRGGVSLLPKQFTSKSYKYWLFKCLTLELVGDKTCNFIVLYRSSNQPQDEFEAFSDNFEMTLDVPVQKNLFLMTTIGEFNTKSKNWYSQNKTSFEGNRFQGTVVLSKMLQESKILELRLTML